MVALSLVHKGSTADRLFFEQALSDRETLSVGEVSSELAMTTRPAEAEGEEANACR